MTLNGSSSHRQQSFSINEAEDSGTDDPENDILTIHHSDGFLPDEPISFKRKQKQVARFSLSNLFSDSSSRPLLGNSQPRSQGTQDRPFQESLDSSTVHGQSSQNGNLSGVKDGGPLDWHVEGPGRRVGYDDLTAIDWIFEYTKERQRKRLLYSKGQGLFGHIRHLLDASHVWLVLIATGIFVGILAASIDIASDWLSDIKTGYCNNGRGGGKFYLNKSFCCWGHEDLSECIDWTPWRKALGIVSYGGGYVVEYIFFILYSVCVSYLPPEAFAH